MVEVQICELCAQFSALLSNSLRLEIIIIIIIIIIINCNWVSARWQCSVYK
jgi:hypothetical protein